MTETVRISKGGIVFFKNTQHFFPPTQIIYPPSPAPSIRLIRTSKDLEDRVDRINTPYGQELKAVFLHIAEGFSPFPEMKYTKQLQRGVQDSGVATITGDGLSIGCSPASKTKNHSGIFYLSWILTPTGVYILPQHHQAGYPVWQSRQEAPPEWFIEHSKSAIQIPPPHGTSLPGYSGRYTGLERDEITSTLARIHARFGEEYRDLFLLAAPGIRDFPCLPFIKGIPQNPSIGRPVVFTDKGIDFGPTGAVWAFGTVNYVFSSRGLEEIFRTSCTAHPSYVLQSAQPAPIHAYSELSRSITEGLKEALNRTE